MMAVGTGMVPLRNVELAVSVDLPPCLRGLGILIEGIVDYPEVVVKRAISASGDKWKIDDSLSASVYIPPGSNGAGVVKIHQLDGEDLIDYYQIEYRQIPDVLERAVVEAQQAGGAVPVVTEINNIQMKEWLEGNGVLTHSKRILNNCIKDRQVKMGDSEPPI